MDNGLMGRSQRPTDRQRVAAARAQTTARPAQEASAPAPQQAVRHTSPQADTVKQPRRNWLKTVLIILGVLAVIGAAWFAWIHLKGADATGIDKSKYQAVFFTSGQVYFGKLKTHNTGYMELTDVYYVHTDTAEGQATEGESAESQSSAQLIKRGSEVHGPEDGMIISKDQIVFFENLKPDSEVSQKIESFKKSQ